MVWLDTMQIEFVIVCKFALARDAALPGLYVRDNERKQAQGVVRWNDRETQHVAIGDRHEEGLHRRPHFDGVLLEFVSDHSVEEFPDHLNEISNAQRAVPLSE